VNTEDQLADTLFQVQQDHQRLEQENAHLKAELDYERGWREKYEEQLEAMR
jgi:hypothetical protein